MYLTVFCFQSMDNSWASAGRGKGGGGGGGAFLPGK